MKKKNLRENLIIAILNKEDDDNVQERKFLETLSIEELQVLAETNIDCQTDEIFDY
jgi:hypothetical protein